MRFLFFLIQTLIPLTAYNFNRDFGNFEQNCALSSRIALYDAPIQQNNFQESRNTSSQVKSGIGLSSDEGQSTKKNFGIYFYIKKDF